MTGRVHPFAISRRASAEIFEVIAYIARDSPQNARAVARAISLKIAQLRRFPRAAPVDPDAPGPPEAAEPRIAHASGFVIRYVFPLRKGRRDVVYVVSIQRAAKPPLDDHEYVIRFLQEAAGSTTSRRSRAEQDGPAPRGGAGRSGTAGRRRTTYA